MVPKPNLLCDDRLATDGIRPSGPIPTEKMPTLFEPFTRGSMQGLGLGLYICQEIAKAHGGLVEATSTPNETRFTFRTPLE
ncbi:MAG TPA: HAMP domain-containing sensor histidine kinase [Acetobacteraceae bacterium]|jgi:signal transduction histidine kinase|nr:HAMP domain-containing sensor histidine kinase [Acetobacteraceae bacterium]